MRTQFQLQILGEQLQSMTMQKNETEIKLNDELQRVKQVKQTSIVIIEFSKLFVTMIQIFFLNKRGPNPSLIFQGIFSQVSNWKYWMFFWHYMKTVSENLIMFFTNTSGETCHVCFSATKTERKWLETFLHRDDFYRQRMDEQIKMWMTMMSGVGFQVLMCCYRLLLSGSSTPGW